MIEAVGDEKDESIETVILSKDEESDDVDNGLVYDHVELNQINAANFYELDLHPSSESLYELAKGPNRGLDTRVPRSPGSTRIRPDPTRILPGIYPDPSQICKNA